MILKAVIFSFFPLFLIANNYTSLFYEIGNKNNIDGNILMSIAKIESNFNPYAILVNAGSKHNAFKIYSFLKKNNYKVSYRLRYVSIEPKNKRQADELYSFVSFLYKKNFIKTYDLGIMQINHQNMVSLNEYEYYMDVKKNIDLGAKILYNCFKKYKDDYQGNLKTIECYNKGYRNEFQGDYFRKFISVFFSMRNRYVANQ